MLIPTRIPLSVRTATDLATSLTVAAPRPSKQRSKAAATVVGEVRADRPKTSEVLKQLWELTKLSTKDIDSQTKRQIELVKGRVLNEGLDQRMSSMIRKLSDVNDFASVEKLLEGHSWSLVDSEKVVDTNEQRTLIYEVIWAAAIAKSLGKLPPIWIEDWIEETVRRLDEPFPYQKESMLWLLSIIRDDLPMLQQLRRDSISKGRVGPEKEEAKTLRHAALAYLEAGKEDEFRSLWSSSGTPLLGGEDEQKQLQQPTAMMHHGLLRRGGVLRRSGGKPGPAMLRWYAESLAVNQRTPIPEKPQFETMMVPMMRNLGGKIEKWRTGDTRTEKLRKWRDDYEDSDLGRVLKSLLDYMRHRIVVQKHGNIKDLRRLEAMLGRVEKNERTVVIEWLNFCGNPKMRRLRTRVLPSHPLIVVGQEKQSPGDCFTPLSPEENERVKVMEIVPKVEKAFQGGGVCPLCAMILAVATRGHLMSNEKMRYHLQSFFNYLQNNSKDVSQSIILSNYLNDAVLRHHLDKIQPAVDHSRAAQWIDKEKKELAFVVSRGSPNYAYRDFDYYSLHIK